MPSISVVPAATDSAGALVLAVLAAMLFNRNRVRARTNRELSAKNDAIQHERERADKLLKNILPEKTAAELKINNTVQPVRYESVTVLFSDFKNFTKIAEELSPEELVAELDHCFRLFDYIVEEHGLEKIKTIGDAYMCAGGLPEPNNTHAIDTVRTAIEMQHGLRNLMENGIKDASGAHPGKTIIFARNHSHAVLLQELFDDMYPQYGGEFCRVIDNYGDVGVSWRLHRNCRRIVGGQLIG